MRGSYRLGAVRADPATMVTRERTVPGRILLARDAGFGSGRLTVAP